MYACIWIFHLCHNEVCVDIDIQSSKSLVSSGHRSLNQYLAQLFSFPFIFE